MNYNDVRDEWLSWKNANPSENTMDLSTFAKTKDSGLRSKDRSSAYDAGVLTQLNAGLDRLFRPVGNDLAEFVGKPADEYLGTGQILQSVAKGTPRALAEGLSYASGIGEAELAARLPQFLGIGSAALQGSEAHPEHPLIGAAFGAASLPLGDYVGRLGAKGAASIIDRGFNPAGTAAEVIESSIAGNGLKAHLGTFLGENAAQMGLNTAMQPLEQLATGEEVTNPFSKENLLANAAGVVPFLPITAAHMLQGRNGTSAAIAERRSNLMAAHESQIQAKSLTDAAVHSVLEKSNGTTAADTVASKEITDLLSGEKITPTDLNKAVESKENQSLTNAVATPETQEIAFSKNYIKSSNPEVHASQLADTIRANGLPDAETLTKAITEVNGIIKSMYDSEIEQTKTSVEKSGKNLFVFDQGRSDSVDVQTMNPEAIALLQKEKRIKPITAEQLRDEFARQYALTGGDQNESWVRTTYRLAAEVQNIAREANRLKAIEVQNRLANVGKNVTSKSEEGLQNRFSGALTKLQALEESNLVPKGLSEVLAKTWHDQPGGDLEVIDFKGTKASRADSRMELVAQAMENYQPDTGLTALKGKLITKKDGSTKFIPSSKGTNMATLPLEQALAIRGKLRPLRGEGRTETGAKVMSADAIKEASGREMAARDTETFDFGSNPDDEQTHRISLEGNDKGELLGTDIDIADEISPNELDSKIEYDSDRAQAQRAEYWLSGYGDSNDKWYAVSDLFYKPKHEQTRRLLDLAIQAKLESTNMGSERISQESARARFAQEFYKKPVVTASEIKDSLKSFWGADKTWGAFLNRLKEQIGGDAEAAIARFGLTMLNRQMPPVVHGMDPTETVYNKASALLKKHFDYQGLGPEIAQRYADIGTEMLKRFEGIAKSTQLAEIDEGNGISFVNKVAEQMQILGFASPKFVQGYTNVARALIGLNVGHKTMNKSLDGWFNFMTVSVLPHELLHGLGRNAVFDLQLGDETAKIKAKAYLTAKAQADAMSPDLRRSILQNLLEAVVPDEYLKNQDVAKYAANFIKYGASSSSEFMSTYGQMYGIGLLAGGEKLKNLKEFWRWSDKATADFFRGVFRDVSDFSEGFAQIHESFGDTVAAKVHREVNNLMKNVFTPDEQLVKAQAIVQNANSYLSKNSFDRMTQVPTVSLHLGKEMEGVEYARQTQAIKDAGNLFFGSGSSSNEPNWWMRTFGALTQVAASTNLSVAKDAAMALLNNSSRQRQVMEQILQPHLVRKGVELLQDQNAPSVKLNLPGNEKAVEVLNQAASLLQELGQKNRLQTQGIGQQTPFTDILRANPQVNNQFGPLFANISSEQRGMVFDRLNKMLASTQLSGFVRSKSLRDNAGFAIAKVMLQSNLVGGYADAVQRSRMLMEGVNANNQQMVQQAMNGLSPSNAASFTNIAQQLNAPIAQHEQNIISRPWFLTEQRPGRFLIETKGPNGRKNMNSAQTLEEAREFAKELLNNGHTDPYISDKAERYGSYSGGMPDDVVESFAQKETAAFGSAVATIRQNFGNAVADQIEAEFNPAQMVRQDAAMQTVKKYEANRKLVAGRENLDYSEAFDEYVRGLATNVANRETKNLVQLMQLDPQLASVPKFREHLEQQMNLVLTPSNQNIQKIKTAVSAYYLAGNFGAMMIEPSQAMTTTIPQFIRQGDGMAKAYGRMVDGISKVTKWALNADSLNALADQGAQNQGGVGAETEAYYYRRFLQEHPTLTQSENFQVADEHSPLATAKMTGVQGGVKSVVDAGKVGMNTAMNLMKTLMKTYAFAGQKLSQSTFIAALNKSWDSGLRGEEAFNAAKYMVYNTNYGGGKANAAGLIADTNHSVVGQSVFGVGMVLQSYGLNTTTMMAQLGKDAIFNSNLSRKEKIQAVKAFGHSLTAVTALSGAMGLPFAAAAMALLEDKFGIKAEESTRLWLASLAGEDEELGGIISNVAMNGIANQLLGLDVAGRSGLTGVLGTNAYDGFNLKDMFGPAPSIVGNMVEGVRYLGQGQMGKAAHSLVPQAFKNLAEMGSQNYQFGQFDFRDSKSNLILKPTEMQKIMYAIGFKPKEVRDYQNTKKLLRTSDQIASESMNRDIQDAAMKLLQGDGNAAIEYAQQKYMNDPTVNPQSLIHEIMDRAYDMSHEKDLLATGNGGNYESQQAISKVMPSQKRRSEYDRLAFKDQMLGSMGYPFQLQPANWNDYMHAGLVDSFVDEKGLTRSQAQKQAEMLTQKKPRIF